MKLKKPVKKLVRKEAWIAFLLAVVVIVNLICFIPMSSMISLAMGNGTITDETSDESTALVQEIAEEGIVLLKNDGTLPLAADSHLNVFDGLLPTLVTVVQVQEHYPMHILPYLYFRD